MTQEFDLQASQPTTGTDGNLAEESSPKHESEEEAAPVGRPFLATCAICDLFASEFNHDASIWNQVEGSSSVFPMARVKKIIKADPEVKTVNKEAQILIAKTTVRPTMRFPANHEHYPAGTCGDETCRTVFAGALSCLISKLISLGLILCLECTYVSFPGCSAK